MEPTILEKIQGQLQKGREQLQQSTRPYFLFDDDPDGLAAFLLLYRFIRCGKGSPLKGRPLDNDFAEKINEYQPDLVVILDKHSVTEEFFRTIQAPVLWLDHHQVQHPPQRVTYINPRKFEANIPTSALAYALAQQDAWIAAAGVVSDWEIPQKNISSQISPTYLDPNITEPSEALYTSEAGQIARIFSFILKGKPSHVQTALKLLVRIKNPQELLQGESKEGEQLLRLYKKKSEEYHQLLDQVQDPNDSLLLFQYDSSTTSYTTDLSNELLHNYPEKVILVGRLSSGSYKCSIRGLHVRIDEILEEVFSITPGHGGGHEHACGAVVPEESWNNFVEIFKSKIEQ